MQINSIISMLHLILVWGVGGSLFLLFWNGYESDRTMNGVIRMMAVMAVLFALGILVWIFTGNAQKQAKEFVSKLSLAGQERLVLDYQEAWRGSRTLRAGQKYTYVCGDAGRIYLNNGIIWRYVHHKTIIRGAYREEQYYLYLYPIDKEEPQIWKTKKKVYPKILEYYEKHFPHIVVGHSDEAGYLYRKDRNQFLQLRYYKALNRKE